MKIVEWNLVKAKTNLNKHGISFEEASTVFDDPFLITLLDVEHSENEERYITLGWSKESELPLP